MAERATPKSGKGGPIRAASPAADYVLTARRARVLGGPAVNDNPVPRSKRLRRTGLYAVLIGLIAGGSAILLALTGRLG